MKSNGQHDRIDFAVKLLQIGLPVYKQRDLLRRYVEKKDGVQLSNHQVYKIQSLARAIRVREINKDPNELVYDCVMVIDGIISEQSNSPRDRLAAVALKARLLGLMPDRSGSGGDDLSIMEKQERLRDFLSEASKTIVVENLASNGNGTNGTNGNGHAIGHNGDS